MILKVLSDAGERDVDANVMPSQFAAGPMPDNISN